MNEGNTSILIYTKYTTTTKNSSSRVIFYRTQTRTLVGSFQHNKARQEANVNIITE